MDAMTLRRMRKLVAASGSLVLCLAAASADDAKTVAKTSSHPLTLDAAIRIALENHPSAQAGAWRVEASEGRATQMRLWPNPELEFTAEEMPTDGGGFGESINQVGIAQTVPFPGKTMLDGRIGRLSVHESIATLNALRIKLEKNVKIAFYRVLASQGTVTVARELVDVAGQEASAVAERVKAGGIPAQEQLRANIAWEQAKAQLAGFEGDLEVARRGLAEAIGRSDIAAVPIAGSLRETADYSIIGGARDMATADHPTILAAEMARERAATALKRARIEPMPDVTLGIAGGRDESVGAGIMSFRVSLPLPLIDRGQGKTREARAEAAIAQSEVEATRQRMTRERAEAEIRLRTTEIQAGTYRDKIIPMALEALQLVRTGFDQGKFPFIDLLDTQRTIAEARLAYQQKLLDLNIAQAELQALIRPAKTISQTEK